MSPSVGQSAGYINNIKNGVNLPSMTVFFYICDCLDVTPQEFFDVGRKNPSKANELFDICRSLDDKQIDNLIAIAKDLILFSCKNSNKATRILCSGKAERERRSCILLFLLENSIRNTL